MESVLRGFSNMIRLLTNDFISYDYSEYIGFLEDKNLIGLLINKIRPIVSKSFAGLRSIEILQQLAENIGKE